MNDRGVSNYKVEPSGFLCLLAFYALEDEKKLLRFFLFFFILYFSSYILYANLLLLFSKTRPASKVTVLKKIYNLIRNQPLQEKRCKKRIQF